MSDRTTHYGLIKPSADDYYSIDDFNANADAVDAALKAVSDGAEPARAVATPAEATAGIGGAVRGWTAQRVRLAADAAVAAAAEQDPDEPGYVPNTPWNLLVRNPNVTIHYRGMNNIVYVQIRAGAAPGGTYTAATLPEGFRPAAVSGTANLISFQTQNSGRWTVHTNGEIVCDNGGGTCFCFSTIS